MNECNHEKSSMNILTYSSINARKISLGADWKVRNVHMRGSIRNFINPTFLT